MTNGYVSCSQHISGLKQLHTARASGRKEESSSKNQVKIREEKSPLELGAHHVYDAARPNGYGPSRPEVDGSAV